MSRLFTQGGAGRPSYKSIVPIVFCFGCAMGILQDALMRLSRRHGGDGWGTYHFPPYRVNRMNFLARKFHAVVMMVVSIFDSR